MISEINREVASEFIDLISGRVAGVAVYNSGVMRIYTYSGKTYYISDGVIHTTRGAAVKLLPLLVPPVKLIQDCEFINETICKAGCGCGCLLDLGLKRSVDPEEIPAEATHCCSSKE